MKCRRSGNLNGFRATIGGGLFVTSATISRDDGDRRMCCDPLDRRRGLTSRQNVDDTPPLKIIVDRPISTTTLRGPIPTTRGFRGRLVGMPSANAKERIFCSPEGGGAERSLVRRVAQSGTVAMDQSRQPRCPAGARTGYCHVGPLDEDPLTAIGRKTSVHPPRIALRRDGPIVGPCL